MQQPTWGAHPRPWFASYYGNDAGLVGQIQAWFSAIDTDRSGQLDQNELGRALQQAGLNFGPATLRRLLMTFDLDRSGHLGVNEFVCLYQFVLALRQSFANQDHDRSGKLDNWHEITSALANAGFTLSPQAINSVLSRFDPNRSGLTLEGYTDVALYLASIRSYFDFYAHAAQQTFGQPPATKTPPGISPPSTTTITINFDQLVSATPYFQ